VEGARASYRPTITLDGAGRTRSTRPIPPPRGEGASIGLTLTQPIYRGGQLASLERQALAQAAAVRASLNQQTRINVQIMGNAWAQLRIANAQIQAADQQIAAAELAFEGVREEASLGARTTLDVLDAEQDVLDARISRIEAQTSLYSAAYSILSAGGLLTVQHLGLDVPGYDPSAPIPTSSPVRPRACAACRATSSIASWAVSGATDRWARAPEFAASLVLSGS
jgi:outer membrane protein